jgi:phosphoglycolate phosphatase
MVGHRTLFFKRALRLARQRDGTCATRLAPQAAHCYDVRMTYLALISDLDGTLLDSLQDLADAVNAALAGFGFPGHSPEEYRRFVGDGRRPLAERSLPEDRRTEELIDLMSERIGEEYAKRLFDTTKPYDGVPEMLDALAAHGVRIAVLTNKPQENATQVVAKLLPRWSFEVIAGESDSTPRKPDPAGALRIADRMGLPPSAFVFLGDSSIDMHTAAAAGMYPVGALWGFRTKEELLSTGARKLAAHPADVAQLFTS